MEKDVNTAPYRAHFAHATKFSAYGPGMPRDAWCVRCTTICSSLSCIMSRSHSLWSYFPPFPLSRHIPSLLHLSHSDEQPLDPRTQGRSGRLAIQSPLTMDFEVFGSRLETNKCSSSVWLRSGSFGTICESDRSTWSVSCHQPHFRGDTRLEGVQRRSVFAQKLQGFARLKVYVSLTHRPNRWQRLRRVVRRFDPPATASEVGQRSLRKFPRWTQTSCTVRTLCFFKTSINCQTV